MRPRAGRLGAGQHHPALSWDERFSARNKVWAEEVPISSDKQHKLEFIVASHPAVLDSVVAQYRTAYQAMDQAQSSSPALGSIALE